jgi:replicative DNA helicase
MTAQVGLGPVASAAGVVGVAVDELLHRTDDDLRRGLVPSPPVPLGFPVLDAHIGSGLMPADLAVLAGAQGVGKTTFALQIARNLAASGVPVTFLCFEHEAGQLLERLLVLEANLVAGDAAPSLADLREVLGRPGSGLMGHRVGHLPGLPEALGRVESYGRHLHIVSARGDTTGIPELRAATAWHERAGLVVVDYLQKMHVDLGDEEARVAQTATALKDFALETGHAVLAISALDRVGLEAKRIRARHLKGSVTLAYEADLIMMLQHKYDVVARDKLVYNLARARDMHQWVVLSLEKNRHGDDQVDLTFRKRLARGYFDPNGHLEDDPLVDERLHIDG